MRIRKVVTRDGEITDRVPLGIDPGWDHNVDQRYIGSELAAGAKRARLPRQLRGPIADKTIMPAFQTALGKRWDAFQTGVKAEANPAGTAQVEGVPDSAALDGLATKVPAPRLTSSSVAAGDDLVEHAASSAWPADWVDSLPAKLCSHPGGAPRCGLGSFPCARLAGGRCGPGQNSAPCKTLSIRSSRP